MIDLSFDDFDQLLRREMQNVPLPDPILDLAAIAMERADVLRDSADMVKMIARQQQRGWLINAVTLMVVLAVAIFVCSRISNAISVGSQYTSFSQIDQESDSSAGGISVESRSSGSSAETIYMAVAILLALAFVVIIEHALSTGSRQLPEIRLGT
jgi:hypothetical protein